MKLFVWTDRVSFLAVAHAETVADARRRVIEDMGESGDGTCPERDKARKEIKAIQPSIYVGPTAEFVLTDSAEQRELDQYMEKQSREIRQLKERMMQMSNAMKGLLACMTGEAKEESSKRGRQ